VLGLIVDRVLRRIEDPVLGIVLTLLLPAATYLPAEELGFSGVLSVVTAGLIGGRSAARTLTSAQRVQGTATWEVVLFIINGLVFILIGLQLRAVLEAIAAERSVAELVGLALAVSIATIVARFAWVFPATYLPRMLSRRIRTRDPAPPVSHVIIVSWAGMRGVVSLAAALALPLDFAGRDLILFLTFAVILATLVFQGLTLPLLIRKLGLVPDSGEAAEEALARRDAVDAALERIEGLADEWPDHRELVDQLRVQYEHRESHIEPEGGPLDEAETELAEHAAIRRAVTDAERGAVLRLRDEGAISDAVLRRIYRELDLEELRMEA
jgi:CPA1 family monovalent cation:H+ antiporter